MLNVDWIETTALTPNRRNARTHSKKQIEQIAASITAFGFLVPILVDEPGNIIAGHGRHAAAQHLGLDKVPVIAVNGLSPAKKRALALADNKIAENAGWDREILAIELPELSELLVEENLNISITGFVPPRSTKLRSISRPMRSMRPMRSTTPCLTNRRLRKLGQLWQLGPHRILCGDARDPATLECLMDGSKAAMAFLDPPYNVRVRDIVGRGQVKHEEFAMGSGEMSQSEIHQLPHRNLANGGKCLQQRRRALRVHGLAPYRRSPGGRWRRLRRPPQLGGVGQEQRWPRQLLPQPA